MWTLQALDHEEGSGARWFELENCRRDTREEVRDIMRNRMRQWNERYPDEVCMFAYRIVEVGTSGFYAQPTDALEY